MTETPTLGIVKNFATEIKNQPEVYMGFELSNEQLEGIMNEAVQVAQKEIPGLQINSQLRVNMVGEKCAIAGKVGVDYPGFGHSEVNVRRVQIGNAQVPGLLRVEAFDVDKNLSFQVRTAAAVAGINIDQEIAKALQNPYQGIYGVMKTELQKQGVKLGQLGLQLNEGKLAMGISGSPVMR